MHAGVQCELSAAPVCLCLQINQQLQQQGAEVSERAVQVQSAMQQVNQLLAQLVAQSSSYTSAVEALQSDLGEQLGQLAADMQASNSANQQENGAAAEEAAEEEQQLGFVAGTQVGIIRRDTGHEGTWQPHTVCTYGKSDVGGIA